MIPYGKQNINQEDINSVIEVMNSDYLTQGPITPKFEKELSKYCGAKHSVAVVNATSALHLACLALNVGKGDVVWTSPISFVASANCAKYCGAEVDFVDIDLNTYNISTHALEEKLIAARKKNKLPKVIIPVHLAGQSCDMKKIKELSIEYGFKIIEDASHAIGGKYLGEAVGNCRYSDISVFSFHPVKIITTCEGGVCMTNDFNIYEKIYRLRSHGIVRNQNEMQNNSHGSWYYEQIDLGFNFRLNDLQSALGINQLKRIDDFVSERHKIVAKYDSLFKEIPFIITPKKSINEYSSFHLYIIRVSEHDGIDRKVIFERLRNAGFYVNVHYIPIYRQPYYDNLFDYKDFPNAEKYYSEAISLPIYPNLKDEEIQKVLDTIVKPSNFQNLF
ncbi:UDP-4-amino-4,6-dideoxy-N-acetyl-beta-L-altrosamine transaminase [Flavobacteriaceae bacterium]|nr:UDP-4-amino-4,6-dideoxy-N-acetyl-beta-L-altrosamine transaminase [Flavobacteriaceae bacterium]MDC1543984.1 UDP-4-amino-4,6-dideoxy-N-acetyl-beta-L-altrosamine transaminase [Flavobacteriaceae bacterium]